MGTFPGLAGHTHCGPFPGEPPGGRCFLCPSLPFPWEPLLSGPPLPPAPAPVLPGSAPRVPGLPTLLVNIPGQPWPLQASSRCRRPLGTGSHEPASARALCYDFSFGLRSSCGSLSPGLVNLVIIVIIMIIIIFPPYSPLLCVHPQSASVSECSCLWLHSFPQEKKKLACLM